jgi:hypothetical protein
VAIATAKVAGATMAVAKATETMSTAPNGPGRGRPVVAVVTMTYDVRDFIGSKHMGPKQIEPRWILGGLEVMEQGQAWARSNLVGPKVTRLPGQPGLDLHSWAA